jgi:hypothetical protein
MIIFLPEINDARFLTKFLKLYEKASKNYEIAII